MCSVQVMVLSFSLQFFNHPWHMGSLLPEPRPGQMLSGHRPRASACSHMTPPPSPTRVRTSAGPFHPGSRDRPDPRLVLLTSAAAHLGFPLSFNPGVWLESKLSSSTPPSAALACFPAVVPSAPLRACIQPILRLNASLRSSWSRLLSRFLHQPCPSSILQSPREAHQKTPLAFPK